MALPKLFQRIFWHNNTTPAINEDNLNAMSKGLDDLDDRVIGLANAIVEAGPQAEEFALESEAWAQGTKNGVPVDPTDPQYQNNSKWYAQHPDFDLGDIKDVEITDPEDGEALIFDSGSHKWKNGTADVGLFVKNGILTCRFETE